jgi:hypothetical protein
MQILEKFDMWFKTTEMWASGLRNPTFIYYSDDLTDEEVAEQHENLEEQRNNKNSWSDKWRHLIIEKIDHPDNDWLEKEMYSVVGRIKGLQSYLKFLEEERTP